MRAVLRGIAVLVVVVWATPATAHHSTGFFFDMTRAITLVGEVLRVAWVNPHILLFLQSTNEEGEPETWILEGLSFTNGPHQARLRERLQPGTRLSVRVHPPRDGLYLNDALTVLRARSDAARPSSRIAEAGQIRFPDGDLLTFGGGPSF